MALKLKVHWRKELLLVEGVDDVAIRELIDCPRHPHVREAANDVLVEDFFGVNNVVPDVSRYRIGIDGCCVRHDSRYRFSNDRYVVPHCDVSGRDLRRQLNRRSLLQFTRRRPSAGNVVLLLESPHKDEYHRDNVNCPIAPANGTTGENIDRCLSAALSQIEEELIAPGCHVIISNPIQFQTSLHAIHGRSTRGKAGGRWRTLRDRIWKTLWNEGGQENYIRRCFRERLNTYRPSVIINACTGAWTPSGDDDPKSLVNDFLDTESTVPLYKTYHPSHTSWRKRETIRLTRIV